MAAKDFTEDNEDFQMPKDDNIVTGSYMDDSEEEITLLTQEKLLEPGNYRALLTRIIGPKKNENTGNNQLQFNLVFTEENDAEIKKITDFVTLTPEAAWRQLEIAVAFGQNQEGKNSSTFKKKDIVGKGVFLNISIDEYQGRKRNKVKNYLPPDIIAKKLAEEKWAEFDTN